MRDGVIFDLDDEGGDMMYNLFTLEGEVDNLSHIKSVEFLISELRKIAHRTIVLAGLLEKINV